MTFIEHDCPLCGSTTLGHAVEDMERVLCRDCFLDWIRAEGSHEERLASMGYDDAEHAAELLEAMRVEHARLPMWNGEPQ